MRNLAKLISSFLFLAIFLVQSAVFALAEADVEFILDISGSMREKLNGETQIESARKALMNSLNEINPKQLVALRVYGHRVEQTKKQESCKDTELLIPFKQLDKAEFAEKISHLTPKGYTPIAYSLEESRNDLLDVGMGREVERVIILMTDGEETCDGDAIKVLQKLKDEGFKLTVYTVGFNVNQVARDQLQKIASFTGGKFFEAKDAKQLTTALGAAAKQSATVVLEKKKASYGTPIRGGDSYETAVPMEFNKEYHLDHHQKVNDYDYFSVDLKRGEEVTLSLSTLEKGVDFNADGTVVESQNPYAGLKLHDSQRNKQKEIDIIGTPSKLQTEIFRPKEDGKYFVLLGSTYHSMNGDSTLFKVTVEKKGDLGTEVDAGDDVDAATPIEAKRYPKNSIGDVDQFDVYALSAKKGDKYIVGIIPNSKDSSSFGMRVIDEFKQQLYSKFTGSNSGLKSEPIEIPEDGVYYIELRYDATPAMDYSLVIKKQEAAPETGGGAPAPEAGGEASGGQ